MDLGVFRNLLKWLKLNKCTAKNNLPFLLSWFFPRQNFFWYFGKGKSFWAKKIIWREKNQLSKNHFPIFKYYYFLNQDFDLIQAILMLPKEGKKWALLTCFAMRFLGTHWTWFDLTLIPLKQLTKTQVIPGCTGSQDFSWGGQLDQRTPETTH